MKREAGLQKMYQSSDGWLANDCQEMVKESSDATKKCYCGLQARYIKSSKTCITFIYLCIY